MQQINSDSVQRQPIYLRSVLLVFPCLVKLINQPIFIITVSSPTAPWPNAIAVERHAAVTFASSKEASNTWKPAA